MNRVIQARVDQNIRTIAVEHVPEGSLAMSFIRSRVGRSDGHSYFECVYDAFLNMPQIVIVCDVVGKLEGMGISLFTRDDSIAGDVLICSVKEINGEFDLHGMNDEELEEVLERLPDMLIRTNAGKANRWN